MKRLAKKAYLVLLLLAMASAGGVLLSCGGNPSSANDGTTAGTAGTGGAPGSPPEVPINVVVAEVKAVTLPDAILLPSTVIPAKTITVPAEIGGAIDTLSVEEGAVVKEGDLIARIDTRTLAAQSEEAQAMLDLAQRDFERSRRLIERNVISREEFDRAKSNVDVRKAQADVAAANLAKGTVAAPASGVLNRRFVERGEYVLTGAKIAEIVQVNPIKVAVDIPEKDIKYVSVGSQLGVVLDGSTTPPAGEAPAPSDLALAIARAVSDRRIVIGPVTYKSVVADTATRTYRVEVTVPNPETRLLPGMIVRVVLLRRLIENAVAVPLSAVVPREGRAVVYVVDGDRAREREVALGITDGRNIEIKSGLAAGETLVTDGQRQLADDQLVRVVEPRSDKAAPETLETGAQAQGNPK